MNRLSRGNVESIRARTLPAVLEMPPSLNHVPWHRSKVVQIPSFAQRAELRSPVVVEMPEHGNASTADAVDVKLPVNSEAHYSGFRIAMIALLTLFGWPHPTRDNDPGPAAAARPWRFERLSLVGRRRLTASVAQSPGSLDEAAAAASTRKGRAHAA